MSIEGWEITNHLIPVSIPYLFAWLVLLKRFLKRKKQSNVTMKEMLEFLISYFSRSRKGPIQLSHTIVLLQIQAVVYLKDAKAHRCSHMSPLSLLKTLEFYLPNPKFRATKIIAITMISVLFSLVKDWY